MQQHRLFTGGISLIALIGLLQLLPGLQSAWPLQNSWLLLVFAVLQLLCLLVFALLVSLLDKSQEQIKTGLISPIQGQ